MCTYMCSLTEIPYLSVVASVMGRESELYIW